jgi:hypothetical protein
MLRRCAATWAARWFQTFLAGARESSSSSQMLIAALLPLWQTTPRPARRGGGGVRLGHGELTDVRHPP